MVYKAKQVVIITCDGIVRAGSEYRLPDLLFRKLNEHPAALRVSQQVYTTKHLGNSLPPDRNGITTETTWMIQPHPLLLA